LPLSLIKWIIATSDLWPKIDVQPTPPATATCYLVLLLPLHKWIMPDNGNFLPLGQLLLPCSSSNTPQQQQHTDQHTHVPLADRSLNKITFKFNCKCILSVGFLLLLLVLALDSPSLLTAIMLHIFLWQCPTPASPSRRPRRWPFTIKCNYFCNIHLQLPLLLLLLLLLLDVAGVAATSCLAYFRLPQRPGDRVIKVNLVTIYRHICFCCRCCCCCCRCSCKLQVARGLGPTILSSSAAVAVSLSSLSGLLFGS